jgi:sugar/nucleoside kinase (ribokinase family)/fructoselysine-6-P-deglycase FrlB-like protein
MKRVAGGPRTPPAVVALGDPLVDAIFEGPAADPVFAKLAGGGTAGNIAANLAALKLSCHAWGVVGDDWRGDFAVDQLVELGVNVSRIQIVPSRLTRLISEVPNAQPPYLLRRFSPYRLLGDCTLCERPAPTKRCATMTSLPSIPDGPGWLVVDRFSQIAVSAANQARIAGRQTVADIGRLGFIRHMTAQGLRDALTQFDLVFAPRTVASAMASKVGAGEIARLGEAGLRGVLVVTEGPDGAQLIDLRGEEQPTLSRVSPTDLDYVVDNVGAGDVFVAGVLARAWTHDLDIRRESSDAIGSVVQDAMEDVAQVLKSVGARGHLTVGDDSPRSSWKGQPRSRLRELVQAGAPCPLCDAGTPTTKGGPIKAGGRRNVSLLRSRVAAALSRADAIQAASEIVNGTGLTVCIGAGGSYAAAVLAALAINRYGPGVGIALRPMEYLLLRPQSNQLLAVSYSGSGPDIQQAILAASAQGIERIFLLTARPQPALLERVGSNILTVAAYGEKSHRTERGFVSIAATVAPAAVFAASICGREAVAELAGVATDLSSHIADVAAFLADTLGARQPIEVLGTGWAVPAMYDLESKFTEAGLGVCRVHEAKDFSHGRFMSVLGQHPRSRALVLGVGKATGYEQRLVEVLRRHCMVTEIRSADDGVLGAVDLLAHVQFVVEHTGRLMDRDISRPKHIEPDGLALYNWSETLDD